MLGEAACWTEQFPAVDIQWDYSTGISYINGKSIPTRIYFKNDADFLMFKLKFGDMLL